MVTLSSVAVAVGRGSVNFLINTATAYSVGYMTNTSFELSQVKGRSVVVAIDTVFRIAITHVLDALKIPFLEKGRAGHLLFSCLTLLTQPLSLKIAQKFGFLPAADVRYTYPIIFAYIALGWKANIMLKDVMYLTGLKKI